MPQSFPSSSLNGASATQTHRPNVQPNPQPVQQAGALAISQANPLLAIQAQVAQQA